MHLRKKEIKKYLGKWQEQLATFSSIVIIRLLLFMRKNGQYVAKKTLKVIYVWRTFEEQLSLKYQF